MWEALAIHPRALRDRGNHFEPKSILGDMVSFLWVDVASIDQRNDADKLSEIGRQAKIFTGALCVYIWLGQHSYDVLESTLTTLIDMSTYAWAQLPAPFDELECMKTDYALTADAQASSTAVAEHEYPTPGSVMFTHETNFPEDEWLPTTLNCLQNLCGDPRFTSLWTLQEAFPCPYSVFMSRDAACA